MTTQKLIAHRGWQRRYPENSLPGIEAALALGARHIEIDIQLNAQYQAYLCHDQKMSRLCGIEGDIHQLDEQQLMPFSPYEPQRLGNTFQGLPFSKLGECIDLICQYPGTTLYIELKQESIDFAGAELFLDSIAPAIEKAFSQCLLISFNIDILQRAAIRGWRRLAPVLSSWAQLKHSDISQLHPEYIFCNIKYIPNDADLHNTPSPLAIYEVDSPQLAQQLLDRGAGLIESFAIGEMIQASNQALKFDNRNPKKQ